MEQDRDRLATIALESCDKQIFLVTLKVARHSELLKQMLDATGSSGDDDAVPLPKVQVHSVPDESARRRLEYDLLKFSIMNFVLLCHQDDPAMEVDVKGDVARLEQVDQRDRVFMGIHDGLMLEMLNAANNMDIKGLTNLICKLLTEKNSRKSAQEVRTMFHIQNDLDQSQEEQISKENQWAQEK